MALLVFNTGTKVFTITLTHNIATPVNGYIHKGEAVVSGSPVFPFTGFTSPVNYTAPVLVAIPEAGFYAHLNLKKRI